METPAILTGNYTRPDDLSPFEYEVTLERIAGGRLAWVATVTSGGAFRGRPRGVLDDVAHFDAETIHLALRDVIETSIRDRIGIR